MRRTLPLFAPALALLVLAFSPPAEAQIYKYKKQDGSVVYTDSLAELPPDRRRYYNQREQERKRKQQQLKEALGSKEYERRKAEEERARILREETDRAERERRLAEIDARLKSYEKDRRDDASKKAKWQARMRAAKKRLAELLDQFKKKQKEHSGHAMQAFKLPGQAKKQQDLKAELVRMEAEIDRLIEEVYTNIPEEARRAGVPPGWLR